VKPVALLTINGRDVSSAIFGEGGILISLTITDQAGTKSDTLELEIDDREGFTAPPKGAEVQAWLGYEPTPVYMGRFTVDEWTKAGPVRTLRVSAKAAEMTSTIRAAKTKSWDGKTVGDIAREIAGEHGLQAVVAESVAGLSIAHIDQQNESDLGFLSRLARRAGATFKLGDGQVVLSERGAMSTLPSGKEKPTIRLTPDMVGEWSATTAERGDYKAVVCTYMDHAAGRRVSVTEGEGTPKHRDRRLYASEAEAKAAARAQLGDLTRGKITFETSGTGLPDVFAEAKIDAQDFDPDVDGEFLIKSVTHSFTSGGYTTSISMETGGEGDEEGEGD